MHIYNILIAVLALLLSTLVTAGAWYLREAWRTAKWDAGQRLR